MILIDSTLHEIGEVFTDIDCEVGTSDDSSNDFEVSNSLFLTANPYGFYIPSTEYGGIFEYSKGNSEEAAKVLKGYTWRGLLTQSLITPPTGSDYKVVSGEANTIIRNMLASVLGGFFTVPTTASGLTISNYQFPLYINTLDGLEGMLEKYGYRLKIHAEKVASGEPIQIIVEAVQATQVSGTYNDDNGIPLTYEVNQMGINHLVCAGEGQLQNRLRVDLYLDANGNVSQTKYYTGFLERVAFYDFGTAESEQDLIDYGSQRLLELASSKTLSMTAPDLDLAVGDLVRGVYPNGEIVTNPIVRKIYTISNGLENIELKVKGEY